MEIDLADPTTEIYSPSPLKQSSKKSLKESSGSRSLRVSWDLGNKESMGENSSAFEMVRVEDNLVYGTSKEKDLKTKS